MLYPCSTKGEWGILFYLCPSVLPSVQDIFHHIFLSNCWWQKSDTVNVEIFAGYYFHDLVGQTFRVWVNFTVSGLQNYKFRYMTIFRKYCSENKVIKIEFSFFVCLKINRRFPEGNQLSIIHVHVPVLMWTLFKTFKIILLWFEMLHQWLSKTPKKVCLPDPAKHATPEKQKMWKRNI